ncbi:hypothetical protein XELAEV_18027720mg [Xenopus laevis]|uniref:Uncharacterized protein n=1 Tax=Xenopus laevis TaxID=8355 RepID=A0A974CWW5_XENLA|nr:hypothetical protein XELAEV_18027720mg [Xenopus laevis]
MLAENESNVFPKFSNKIALMLGVYEKHPSLWSKGEDAGWCLSTLLHRGLQHHQMQSHSAVRGTSFECILARQKHVGNEK